jgi:hypothetical protein
MILVVCCQVYLSPGVLIDVERQLNLAGLPDFREFKKEKE